MMNIESNVGSLTEPVTGRHWDRREIQRLEATSSASGDRWCSI